MLRVTKLADYGIIILTRLARPRPAMSSAREIAAGSRLPCRWWAKS